MKSTSRKTKAKRQRKGICGFNFVPYLYFSAFVFCLLPTAALGGWQKQQSGTFAWLRSIYFFDERRGFVVGASGTILTTQNGGETWEKTVKPSDDNFRDIVFTGEKTGWILAERSILKTRANEPRSYLLHTTDGGKSWRRTDFPVNQNDTVIHKFVLTSDRQKIWAIGETGALYFFDGSTWQRQAAPTRYLLNDGWWFDNAQGWLVGAGGAFLTTTDGGKNWRETNFADNPRLNAVFFVTAKIGWAAGASGKIFSTVSGGNHWRSQNSNTANDLFDIIFLNQREGFAVGDAGLLLMTKNGGASWTTEKIKNTNHRLERLFFLNESRGWAVGFGGTIVSFSK